jgi:hypothetical protein
MRRYLHGQLNEHENAEVETHLKHCVHCSEAIIQYVETEEPENYKVYIKVLKGKIIQSVKPKSPKLSSAQIKVMRAAAAVVILLTFSFFAFENLIDKDFNLVARPEKKEDSFVRKSAFPQDKQKPAIVTEQAQQKIAEEAVPDAAEEMKEKPEVKVAAATPKPQKPVVNKTTAKVEAKKVAPPKEEVKQPVATNTVPKVVNNTLSKEDESATEEVPVIEKTNSVAQVEKTEPQQEDNAPRPVAPIQKIEKVNIDEGGIKLTEEEPAQVVPSATIGQLRQRK